MTYIIVYLIDCLLITQSAKTIKTHGKYRSTLHSTQQLVDAMMLLQFPPPLGVVTATFIIYNLRALRACYSPRGIMGKNTPAGYNRLFFARSYYNKKWLFITPRGKKQCLHLVFLKGLTKTLALSHFNTRACGLSCLKSARFEGYCRPLRHSV